LAEQMLDAAALRELLAKNGRACQIVSADRKMIRYRSCRSPEVELWAKLRDLANERRRFGYRRLFVLLRRNGEPSGVNRIYRLYSEEGPSARVRRFWSRRKQMPVGLSISSTTSLHAG
jgi:transposase InsO family protein